MATRKMIDCRKIPSQTHCSVSISGTEEEIIPLAMYHAVAHHQEKDGPELREQIRGSMGEARD